MSRSAPDTRPSLSQDVIIAAALRALTNEPTTPLTMSRLGAELGADPTAVYRHFRNRDELLLGLIDQVYGEGFATYEPSDDWRTSLRSLAHGLWDAMMRRPALAAEVGSRFTGGPHERIGIIELQRQIARAGFDHDDVLLHARAFGAAVLDVIAATAQFLVRDADAIEHDMRVARDMYGAAAGLDAVVYERQVYDLTVDTLIAGMTALGAAASAVERDNRSEREPSARDRLEHDAARRGVDDPRGTS